MPAPWLLAPLLLSPRFDLYGYGPYSPSVPRPERVVGYELGSRIAAYRDVERYDDAVAQAAPDRVRLWSYGKSVQGRPLRLLAISDPANLKALDRYQKAWTALAEGRTPEVKPPVLVWVNQCIHGNEPASVQSGMALVYTLAASRNPALQETLRNAVVIVNPLYNPDGAERFATWYNAIARGDSAPGAYELQEPSVVHGRTNQYRFDMNRDRVAFSQDETRQEFAEFLRWRPQIYIDQHGQVGTYFFPPEPQSINPNVDRARNEKWTESIGRAIGKAFDAAGFSYFVKDTYDLYYPGYVDSSTTLSGAVGMTHETDGGKYLNDLSPDGYTLTLRRGIEKHFLSALSVVQASAGSRDAILASAGSFAKRVTSGEAAGTFRRVVLASEDPRPLLRLQTHLARAGIRSSFLREAARAGDAHDYWTGQKGEARFPAGSLVVDLAQPQGALAKSLLEPGNGFEPEFVKAQLAKRKAAPEGEEYPGPESTEFYDQTGWALPYAYGLSAWWTESAPALATTDRVDLSPAAPPASTVGYALPYCDEEDALFVARALLAGVRGAVSTKPMRLRSGEYGPGTFLFLADRNEPGYDATLKRLAEEGNVRLEALGSSYPEADRYGPGSDAVARMTAPKIGIVFGDGASLGDVGGLWYAFDRSFRLPFTALSASALRRDLSAYTVIIVPDGVNVADSTRLKDWVRDGGRLIAMGMPRWALGQNGFVSLAALEDVEDLPGPLLRARLDARFPLAYGYGRTEIAVPAYGSRFYRRRKEGGAVLTLPGADTPKLLTGWAWPDETDKQVADAVFAQDEPFGRGHVILFQVDPTDRALWPGLHKLLLNAVLMPN